MAAQTFTLLIPAGHRVLMIDLNGRSRSVNLACDVTIDDATHIFGSEYRYEVGDDACVVHVAPLLTDSRVTVIPN